MATQPPPSELSSDWTSSSVETPCDDPQFLRDVARTAALVEHRVLQVYAVVDANVVQGELRWRLGSRENPEARSGLEEALDVGVLVPISPNVLKVEIEKYLPVIAEQTRTTLFEDSATTCSTLSGLT